jgi:hypothetical protein
VAVTSPVPAVVFAGTSLLPFMVALKFIIAASDGVARAKVAAKAIAAALDRKMVDVMSVPPLESGFGQPDQSNTTL